MKKEVKFVDDAVDGNDCVLHLSMSGSHDAIVDRLKSIIDQMDSSRGNYGKPIQGVVSQYHLVSHVITPIWKGIKY